MDVLERVGGPALGKLVTAPVNLRHPIQRKAPLPLTQSLQLINFIIIQLQCPCYREICTMRPKKERITRAHKACHGLQPFSGARQRDARDGASWLCSHSYDI